jgi:peroxiredoxin Q/BCP
LSQAPVPDSLQVAPPDPPWHPKQQPLLCFPPTAIYNPEFRMSRQLQAGDRVPEFTAIDQDGDTWDRARVLAGGPCVIYFYPRDETPGCTAEACSFRDEYAQFSDMGARVFGISADSPASHKSFAAHHRLPFRLLSDTDHALQKAFGVKAFFGVLPGRVTFVCDSEGVVHHAFSGMLQARKHVTESLQVLRKLT